MKDISSVFAGLSTPPQVMYDQISQAGWEMKKVQYDKKTGQMVAIAKNPFGEEIAKTGPDDATALGNLLHAILRRNHLRTPAQWKVGMWNTTWTDKLPEIAEAYSKAPVYDPKAAAAWKLLGDDSLHRMEVMGRHMHIEPTNDPVPYKNHKQMLDDIHKKRHISISKQDLDHPVWTPEQALAFRAVHHVLGHGVAGSGFDWHGRNLAVSAHMPLLDPVAQQALFTEAIARPAYESYYRVNAPTKIAFIKDHIEPAQAEENPAGHRGIHPNVVPIPTKVPEMRLSAVNVRYHNSDVPPAIILHEGLKVSGVGADQFSPEDWDDEYGGQMGGGVYLSDKPDSQYGEYTYVVDVTGLPLDYDPNNSTEVYRGDIPPERISISHLAKVGTTIADPNASWDSGHRGIHPNVVPIPTKVPEMRLATTRSLYHGTLIDHMPDIQRFGLQPDVGPFTQDAYQSNDPEYADAMQELMYPQVFMADKTGLNKALTAMRYNISTKLNKGFHEVTPLDIRNHGLLVKQPSEMGWSDNPLSDKHLQLDYRPDEGGEAKGPWEDDPNYRGWDDDQYSYQVEPGDYYSDSPVGPHGLHYIYGPALLRTLRNNGLLDHQGVFSKVSSVADPNANWESGIDPLPYNAYLHHGDPLGYQDAMDNSSKYDTGWSNFKTGEGTPDMERMKQAVVNAFRVALLSPRKDLRWNAIHYQDISHIPAGTTDPGVYHDALENARQTWNVKNYGEESRFSHLPYAHLIPELESVIFHRDPTQGYQAAKQKAHDILFDWLTEEQEKFAALDKGTQKQLSSNDIERKVNLAVAKRIKLFVKDFQPRLDHIAQQDQLFQPEVVEPLPQVNRYGAWMGAHLKAISQISQHANELTEAALEDVQQHDGSGHHFRAKVLQLGIPGAGPKVASFAWLLLQPMTSQLATIDTHMMEALGHNYDREMNNRDYYKFERELAAGRDASGYAHMPLGAFQHAMWDFKRTGPGTHQDHSAMRVVDPVPHDQVDWTPKPMVPWTSPDWWENTQDARNQVGQEWDDQIAPNWPKNSVPYQHLAKTAYNDPHPFSYWWNKEKPWPISRVNKAAEYAVGTGTSHAEAEKFLDNHKDDVKGNFSDFKEKFFKKFKRIKHQSKTKMQIALEKLGGEDPRLVWDVVPTFAVEEEAHNLASDVTAGFAQTESA